MSGFLRSSIRGLTGRNQGGQSQRRDSQIPSFVSPTQNPIPAQNQNEQNTLQVHPLQLNPGGGDNANDAATSFDSNLIRCSITAEPPAVPVFFMGNTNYVFEYSAVYRHILTCGVGMAYRLTQHPINRENGWIPRHTALSEVSRVPAALAEHIRQCRAENDLPPDDEEPITQDEEDKHHAMVTRLQDPRLHPAEVYTLNGVAGMGAAIDPNDITLFADSDETADYDDTGLDEQSQTWLRSLHRRRQDIQHESQRQRVAAQRQFDHSSDSDTDSDDSLLTTLGLNNHRSIPFGSLSRRRREEQQQQQQQQQQPERPRQRPRIASQARANDAPNNNNAPAAVSANQPAVAVAGASAFAANQPDPLAVGNQSVGAGASAAPANRRVTARANGRLSLGDFVHPPNHHETPNDMRTVEHKDGFVSLMHLAANHPDGYSGTIGRGSRGRWFTQNTERIFAEGGALGRFSPVGHETLKRVFGLALQAGTTLGNQSHSSAPGGRREDLPTWVRLVMEFKDSVSSHQNATRQQEAAREHSASIARSVSGAQAPLGPAPPGIRELRHERSTNSGDRSMRSQTIGGVVTERVRVPVQDGAQGLVEGRDDVFTAHPAPTNGSGSSANQNRTRQRNVNFCPASLYDRNNITGRFVAGGQMIQQIEDLTSTLVSSTNGILHQLNQPTPPQRHAGAIAMDIVNINEQMDRADPANQEPFRLLLQGLLAESQHFFQYHQYSSNILAGQNGDNTVNGSGSSNENGATNNNNNNINNMNNNNNGGGE